MRTSYYDELIRAIRYYRFIYDTEQEITTASKAAIDRLYDKLLDAVIARIPTSSAAA